MPQASMGWPGSARSAWLVVVVVKVLSSVNVVAHATDAAAEVAADGHATSLALGTGRFADSRAASPSLIHIAALGEGDGDEDWAELLGTQSSESAGDSPSKLPPSKVDGDVAVTRISPPPRGFPKKEKHTTRHMTEDHGESGRSQTEDDASRTDGEDHAGSDDEDSRDQPSAEHKHIPRIGEHIIGSPDYEPHPKVLKFPSMQKKHHQSLHKHTSHTEAIDADSDLSTPSAARRGPAIVRAAEARRTQRSLDSDNHAVDLDHEAQSLEKELAWLELLDAQESQRDQAEASSAHTSHRMTPAQRKKALEDAPLQRADPNDPYMPVDCRWKTWEEWSPCSRSCADPDRGPGQRWRVRDMTKELHGGLSCWQLGQGGNSEHQICAAFPCPTTTTSTTATTTSTTTTTTTTTTTSTTTTVSVGTTTTTSSVVAHDAGSSSTTTQKNGVGRSVSRLSWLLGTLLSYLLSAA